MWRKKGALRPHPLWGVDTGGWWGVWEDGRERHLGLICKIVFFNLNKNLFKKKRRLPCLQQGILCKLAHSKMMRKECKWQQWSSKTTNFKQYCVHAHRHVFPGQASLCYTYKNQLYTINDLMVPQEHPTYWQSYNTSFFFNIKTRDKIVVTVVNTN